MSIASGNLDAKLGTRVNSLRLDSGSDEYISLSLSGRRNARRNVDKSVSVFGVEDIVAGIEEKYLKLGNSKADATDDEALRVSEEKEDALTRMLLNGCQRRNVSKKYSLLAIEPVERTYISILPTKPK